jgi:ABC-type Zn2+ transport system substrate-binding protein/surface adhesin
MMARIEREVQQEAREARKLRAKEEKFLWEGREVSEFEYKTLSSRSKVVDHSTLQDQYHKPSNIHDDTDSEEEEEESSESEIDEEEYKKILAAQKAELKRKHEERMKKQQSFYTPPVPVVQEMPRIISNTKEQKPVKTAKK